MAKESIAFEALDNGVLSCVDPARLQQILDDLDETKIQALVDKWLARLPDPFTAEDHAAGFNARLSILQSEFARTQVLDRPQHGRHLFETISQDCMLAEGVFDQVTKPRCIDKQRVASLRFDDERVMSLLQVLCLFLVLPEGFRNATMRECVSSIR